MPKRQSTFKVDSTKVQGKGSYVVIRHVPYGLVRQAAMASEGDLAVEKEIELATQLITEALLEWNWVDDNDVPIPMPKTTEDVDILLTNEVEFLVSAIMGRENLKNSG